MSHHAVKATAVASMAVLALTGLALTGPAALASAATSARAGQPAGATAPAGETRRVMLPTGDIVSVSTLPGGRQSASVIAAHPRGPGGKFRVFSQGSDLYVIPQSAVPYLGSTLSPGLFDVTRLARQQHGTRSLTVTLRLRGRSARMTVPGITVTHRSGDTATGRLSALSARAFGTALARQAERYQASPARSAGAGSLFSGVAQIAPLAPRALALAARHRIRPHFQMYTLTVNGLNRLGKPDTGDLVVISNVDDLRKYVGFGVFIHGRTKVSVPAGHYAATCFFFDLADPAVREVMVPQFTVTSDSASATLDARTATVPVTVRTPQPATSATSTMTVGRADRLGQTIPDGVLAFGPAPYFAEPTTARVSAGQIYYYFYDRLFSPAGAHRPYTYDVEFPSTGNVPASQHFVAAASGLATVEAAYPATHANTSAQDTRVGALPWQNFLIALDVNLTTPLRRTEFYTARPDLSWQDIYYEVFAPSAFAGLGVSQSGWRTYQPGENVSTTWDGQPQHPRLFTEPLGIDQVYCPACLAGSKLDLLAFPFSDNEPGHFGFPDSHARGLTESEAFDVYADGVLVTRGTGLLAKTVTLPAAARDLLIDYNTTRSSPDLTLSTRANTRWTVSTRAPAGALPPGWYCDFSNHTNCSVLPLMTADYELPVNMLGQLSPGPVTATIDVSHLAGSVAVGVKSLTVAVSFSGGTSWRSATVTSQGGGRYAISFTVPATAQTDGFGALKLRAVDVYGGTLSQTIQHAFAVASS